MDVLKVSDSVYINAQTHYFCFGLMLKLCRRENVHCSKMLLCFEFLGFAYKLKVYVLTLDLECDFLIDLSNKDFLFASVF